MPRIFVPGPQPRTRREQAALAASFVVRCATAAVAGAGAAVIVLSCGFSASLGAQQLAALGGF